MFHYFHKKKLKLLTVEYRVEYPSQNLFSPGFNFEFRIDKSFRNKNIEYINLFNIKKYSRRRIINSFINFYIKITDSSEQDDLF